MPVLVRMGNLDFDIPSQALNVLPDHVLDLQLARRQPHHIN